MRRLREGILRLVMDMMVYAMSRYKKTKSTVLRLNVE